jgi:CDP-diacylglycerol pyrophosphatase
MRDDTAKPRSLQQFGIVARGAPSIHYQADEYDTATPCNKREPGSGCAAINGIKRMYAIFTDCRMSCGFSRLVALAIGAVTLGRAISQEITALIFLWLVVVLALTAPAHAGNPDALWQIVNNRCVPDQRQHGDPKPCTAVDLQGGVANGTAVLKDMVGDTQYLLIPTARITGIEDPAILLPGATNYFAAAWLARRYIEQAVHSALPRDDLSLAINATTGRTQNQLHIHIDCTRADVRDIVRQRLASIGDNWAPLGVPLVGHDFLARRVMGEDLATANPFLLLADEVPAARQHMGYQTLVVQGATFADAKPGFVLLNDHANLTAGDPASGEALQDHACAVARQ